MTYNISSHTLWGPGKTKYRSLQYCPVTKGKNWVVLGNTVMITGGACEEDNESEPTYQKEYILFNYTKGYEVDRGEMN